jgi:type IV secretory pathway TraG/TraD family ATPase VirD4
LPSQREFLKPLFSAWVSIIIKGIMARSEQNTSRTWIIIDELASLNRLPSLLTGLAEVRKYGGCFVLGFQDLSQLDDLYGHAATKTLSNLTGTKILFRCVDAEMATRMSKYFGEQEKQEASESISFGAHQMRDGVSLASQTHSKPLVAATQLMMLKDLQCFLKFPGDLPVTQLSIPYLKVPMKNEGFVRKNI